VPSSPDALNIIGEALHSYPLYSEWPDTGCHGLLRVIDFTVDYLNHEYLDKEPIATMVLAVCDELNRRITKGAEYYYEEDRLVFRFTPNGAVLSSEPKMG
jgi:hypothetical protein